MKKRKSQPWPWNSKVQAIVQTIAASKVAILDDFTRAYLADQLTRTPKLDMRRVVLNEQVSADGTNRTYFFTLKPGPLPQTPRTKTEPSKKR